MPFIASLVTYNVIFFILTSIFESMECCSIIISVPLLLVFHFHSLFGFIFCIVFESMLMFVCSEEEDENVENEEEEDDDDDFKNDVLRLFIRMDQFSRYAK